MLPSLSLEEFWHPIENVHILRPVEGATNDQMASKCYVNLYLKNKHQTNLWASSEN